MNSPKLLLVLALAVGLLAVSCTQKKRVEGLDIPTQPQVADVLIPPTFTPTETVVPTATPVPMSKYIVVKGDTLWDISMKEVAYQDNFQWPLIFKQNRDQIKDPDLIYPKQEFWLKHDFTQQEIDKAKKDASDTPKYVPHTQPREALPLDYF